MKRLKAWLLRWRLGAYIEHLEQAQADYHATVKLMTERIGRMQAELEELEA